MDYFAKFVTSPNDLAVKGEFSTKSFRPCTLLALSDFADGLDLLQARAIVELMVGLLDLDAHLLLCRNSVIGLQGFEARISGAARPLRFRAANDKIPLWVEGTAYLIGAEGRDFLSNLLVEFWETRAGTWLFADWPNEHKAVRNGMDALGLNTRQAAEVRVRLLGSRVFAAMSFDDRMLDFYINRALGETLSLLSDAAGRHGVALRRCAN